MRSASIAGLIAAAASLAPLQAASAGSATATITMDGKTIQYAGGDCVHSQGMFAVNIGTPPSASGPAVRPDYFGMTLFQSSGAFSDGGLFFVTGGVKRAVGAASGVATPAGATFSGRLLGGKGFVSGSFRC